MTEPNNCLTPFELHHFESLPSTNAKLKELAQNNTLPEFTVVQTTYQWAGRGQTGNQWESESGKNLTFSLYIRPDFIAIQNQFMVSKVTSLAIVDALKKVGFDNLKIKWPNDIYYHDKKLAGILIEPSIMGANMYDAVIGIGLNVNQAVFESDAPNPISMLNISGKAHDINNILNMILNSFDHCYSHLKQNKTASINNAYNELLFRLNETWPYKDDTGIYDGKIIGIDESGQLKIEAENGNLKIYGFKEVEFVLSV